MKTSLKNMLSGGVAAALRMRLMWLLTCLLAMGSAWADAEETQPSTQRVLKVAQSVAQRLQPFLDDKIHVVQVFRKETSPLLAIPSTDSMCIIVLNKNTAGWAVWERFLDNLPEENRDDMIEIAVAHELGHCFLGRTPPASLALAPSKTEKRASNRDSETYADIFAGAYAHMYMAERAEVPMQKLIRIRNRFSWIEWNHSTGSKLETAWTKLKSETGSLGRSNDQSPDVLVEWLTQ